MVPLSCVWVMRWVISKVPQLLCVGGAGLLLGGAGGAQLHLEPAFGRGCCLGPAAGELSKSRASLWSSHELSTPLPGEAGNAPHPQPALRAKRCLSRPSAACPSPCPGSGFVCALRGSLLPARGVAAWVNPPEPPTKPPDLRAALQTPIPGVLCPAQGEFSSLGSFRSCLFPHRGLAGFAHRCSAVTPMSSPNPLLPPAEQGLSEPGGRGWGGALGSVSDNPVGCRICFPIPVSPSPFPPAPTHLPAASLAPKVRFFLPPSLLPPRS